MIATHNQSRVARIFAQSTHALSTRSQWCAVHSKLSLSFVARETNLKNDPTTREQAKYIRNRFRFGSAMYLNLCRFVRVCVCTYRKRLFSRFFPTSSWRLLRIRCRLPNPPMNDAYVGVCFTVCVFFRQRHTHGIITTYYVRLLICMARGRLN